MNSSSYGGNCLPLAKFWIPIAIPKVEGVEREKEMPKAEVYICSKVGP
jgi:hypothetical protein